MRLDNLTVRYALPAPTSHALKLWMSDTRGRSWLQPISQTLGARGHYNVDVAFRRLGMSRDRVFGLEWSADCKTALLGAFVLFEPAGT